MWLWIYFIISLVALIIATLTDLKERIIPNALTYSVLLLGIGLHGLQSYFSGNYWFLGISVGVAAATFVGSYFLWKAGVWAGGDVKLMTAIAALNPWNYAVLRDLLGLGGTGVLGSWDFPVFPLSLFIMSVFSMLPYGAVISLNGIFRNSGLKKEFLEEVRKIAVGLIWFVPLVVGLAAVLDTVSVFVRIVEVVWLLIPLLLGIGIFAGRFKAVIGVLVFAYALYVDAFGALADFAAGFGILFVLYLLIRLYIVSKEKVLKKEVKVSELEEGIISSEVIYELGGEYVRGEGISIGSIIKHFRNNNVRGIQEMFNPPGRVVVGRSAAGLSDEQILELKKAVKEGLIEDKIMISLSAPFVPAILIGYLVLQLVGDLLWNLALGL